MATTSGRTINTTVKVDGFECRVEIRESEKGAFHIESVQPPGVDAFTLAALEGFPTLSEALAEAREIAENVLSYDDD